MLVTLGLSTWVVGLLVALFLFVCILLILTVLIQRPQGGGLSGAFGSNSGSGQTAFGAKTGDALTIATIGMFVVYVVAAVGLNYAVRPSAAVVEEVPTVTNPAAPGATPATPGATPVEGTTPVEGAAPVEQPATTPTAPGEQPTFTIPPPAATPPETTPPVTTEPAPAAPATPAPTEPAPGSAPAGEPKPAEPAPTTPPAPGGN